MICYNDIILSVIISILGYISYNDLFVLRTRFYACLAIGAKLNIELILWKLVYTLIGPAIITEKRRLSTNKICELDVYINEKIPLVAVLNIIN